MADGKQEGKRIEPEFSMKPEDPSNYLLFVEEGWDDRLNQKAPIARLPGGRTVLFYREHHKYLRGGETWECRIDQDRGHFVFAVPLKLQSRAPTTDYAVGKGMSPETATMLLEQLIERLAVLSVQYEKHRAVVAPLEEKRKAFLKDLNNVEEALAVESEGLDDTKAEIKRIQNSIMEIEALSRMEGTSRRELEKRGMKIPDTSWRS